MSKRNNDSLDVGTGSRPYIQTAQRRSPTARSYSSQSSHNSPSSLYSANSVYLNAPYKVKPLSKPDSKCISIYSESEPTTQPNEYGVICDSRVCENGFSLKDQHEEVIEENEEANETSEYSYYTNDKVSGLDCEIHCHIRTTLGLFIKVNVCPNRTKIIHELLLAPSDLDHLQILDKCVKQEEEEGEGEEEGENNNNNNEENENNNSNRNSDRKQNNRVDFGMQTGLEEEKEGRKSESKNEEEGDNNNDKEITHTIETEEGENEDNNQNTNTKIDYNELCKYISKCLVFNSKGHLVCVAYSDEVSEAVYIYNLY